MNKINYLKIKWNEPNFSEKKLRKYNKNLSSLYFRIVRIELKIESFLYETLNDSDWKKQVLFVNKYSKKISEIIYGDKKKKIKQVDIINFLTKKATLGAKIIFWKGLNSNLFHDKNTIFRKIKENEITNVLENTRNLRNSIAHYEGLQSWKNKMRSINGETELDDIIKITLRKWGV